MKKKKNVREPKGNLVKEIDAAIALLARIRVMADSSTAPANPTSKATKQVSAGKLPKRVLSPDAREAIAAAQRKRWAKVRRQKKQAERAALTK
jgi:hypothetical protein